MMETRLRSDTTTQVLAALFALAFILLTISWTSPAGGANNSWFVVNGGLRLMLGAVAFLWGISDAAKPDARLPGLVTVLVLGLLLTPVAAVSHAVSQPAEPLAEGLARFVLQPAGIYGLSLLTALGCMRLRARWLAAVLVPLLLAGLLVLDATLGTGIFNPLSGAWWFWLLLALPVLATVRR